MAEWFYLSGNRVEDVTKSPFLRIAIDACAMDHTLASEPRYQSLMVENDSEGEPSSSVFMPERSAKDLLRRREIIQLGARVAYGKGTPAKFTGIDGLNTVTVVCSGNESAGSESWYLPGEILHDQRILGSCQ